MPRNTQRTVVSVTKVLPEQYQGDVIALGFLEGRRRIPPQYAGLDRSVGGAISRFLKLGDFKAKSDETMVLYNPERRGSRRIILVGLGLREKVTLDVLRRAAGAAIRKADALGLARVALALHGVMPNRLALEDVGRALAEGAVVGRYNYRDYLPPSEDKKSVPTLRVTVIEVDSSSALQLNRGQKVGTILAESQNRTRAVANRPGNEINPPSLARHARALARQFGLKCTIFDDKKLTQMGMNALLAVGGGSANKSRLIMLEYKGRTGRGTAGPDAAVVGKAITFDSGGISIKSSANMETMKYDKSGGCAVLGVLTGAARLKLPLNLVGLVPSAENLPSHTSYRPGDIIRTYSGKTVEVQNTDAEGRMILCDALAYAARLKPAVIVDMATLTGACVVALGIHKAGLFGNDPGLIKRLQQAAESSGEPIWPLPSGEEYLEQMKSKMADLKNVGGREGGSCTAAAFLGEFVEKTPWAHIDIAAVADTTREKAWRGIGATGFGVRLVLEYLRGQK